jgi:hypothetical protein
MAPCWFEVYRMTRCSVSGKVPTNPDNAPVPNSATLADGQHVDHWVMCPGEIIKAGFVRPVRNGYTHVGPPGPKHPLRDLTPEEQARYGSTGYVKFEEYPRDPVKYGSATGRFWTKEQLDKINKGCGVFTRMPQAIAETYAANPGFYGSTFCCGCRDYLPVGEDGEFVWADTQDRVGT